MKEELAELTAVSPIDGRYGGHTIALRALLSEYGLIKHRVLVELRWFKYLASDENIKQLPNLTKQQSRAIDNLIDKFNVNDAKRIKALEKKTNHDVKAVEYFVKRSLSEIEGLQLHVEFVHFACTSEDINNLAYGLMLDAAMNSAIKPAMKNVVRAISEVTRKYAGVPMLSRTHGQVASPTTMGKELGNVVARLKKQLESVEKVSILGKFNGAVGNYNAHKAAYPDVDWLLVSENFVRHLGLDWNPYTTQIEPHDYMAELFQAIGRFNTILLDFDRDIWSYISINYFNQKKVDGETGSSTMPHKVNPIDFENSEGNLGIANAILAHLAEKLPISRWQRDLTDSTVLRNLGVGLSYSLIAYNSALKGIGKLELNEDELEKDLTKSWEVLSEPIQTIMRKYGVPEPYEKLKAMTRGELLSQARIIKILDELDLPENVKNDILELTPSNYIGEAQKIVARLLKD